MDDQRVWSFEESLWTGPAEAYEEKVDPEVVMALPSAPFVLRGGAAIEAVKSTPRWSSVRFDNQTISRPQEGLIVVGYRVRAEGAAHMAAYEAHCTSTYRRLEHEVWRVVQHAQSPVVSGAAAR